MMKRTRKPLGRSKGAWAAMLIAMASLAIGSGYYKASVGGEQASFATDLPAGENKPVILDLAQ